MSPAVMYSEMFWKSVFLAAIGPMNVTFLNVAVVNGAMSAPVPLLSLSKPFDCEVSAMRGSRIDRQYCTVPLKPLSVSNSSSQPL